MHYYEVAPNKIVRAGSDMFTYASEHPLAIGQLVKIEAGKLRLTGLVMKEVARPAYSVKPVTEVFEERPLPIPLVRLADWLAGYYRTPLATVLQTLLPRGLEKKRRVSSASLPSSGRNRTKIVFTADQERALTAILSEDAGSFLLQGVTGSGKTEVYKELVRRTVAAGRSAIILVPEISLTSQIIGEFTHDFPGLIVTHSQMTEAQRHLAWKQALDGDGPQVVIGPRSALFLPLRDVGAIIVDESHEPSYKQEQAPRYSALRAAGMLGRFHEARVVFGSATPAVSERYVAEQAGRPVIRMDRPARSEAKPPTITVVDMTKRSHFHRHRFISDDLIAAIEKNIASGKQTLVFHNRRGSASTTLCENCGWTAMCPNCYVPLVLHTDTFQLSCHICGHHEKVPTQCPVCGAADIIHKGIGTKLVEQELRKLFPKAHVARFDSDNKADETVNSRYRDLYEGTIDIAIGTQVVAKGLDLPQLRTVGVIQADSGLSLPDYAAAERTFQLLAQVIGRVGRDIHATEVIVQSYQPTNPVIQYGLGQDYESFYPYMLEERRRAFFPPFSYLLQLTNSYATEAGAIKAARSLATTLREEASPDVRILGPTPAFYERGPNGFRWQLVLKSPQREHLINLLAHVPPTHWHSELDPASLL